MNNIERNLILLANSDIDARKLRYITIATDKSDKKYKVKVFAKEISNLVRYAQNELAILENKDKSKDGYDKTMNNHILELVEKFADQGHSGFSASYLTGALERLMRFEPLCPLTGEPDEWMDTGAVENGEPIYQNKRCSHIFKIGDNQAYDIDGYIFKEPNGCCYTGFKSRKPVSFPCIPKSEYIDVTFHEDN